MFQHCSAIACWQHIQCFQLLQRRQNGLIFRLKRVRQRHAAYALNIVNGVLQLSWSCWRDLVQERRSGFWGGRMAEILVADVTEMSDGDRRIVKTRRGEVGVFFKDGKYYAYANVCAHAGGPACEGVMMNQVVDIIAEDRTYQGQTFSDTVHFVCPWHGWEYELETGECVGDRRLRLKKYDVVVRGDSIYLVA